MQSDSYRVKVIHVLNPYLIWVEVLDPPSRTKNFEQIGIYGILPHEVTIDLESSGFVDRSCKKWLPAATNLIQEFLKSASVTWFSPTFIDRRKSVLHDNIHKYGEIIIEKNNGETKKLSEWLTTTGFAEQNDSQFHFQIISGKFEIKLTDLQLKNIYIELEKHGFNSKSKVERNKSPCSRRSVSDQSSNLSKIRVESVVRSNNDFASDFDDEEIPVGRACRRSDIIHINKNSQPYNMIDHYFEKMSTSKSTVSDSSSNKNNSGHVKEIFFKEQTQQKDVIEDKQNENIKPPKAMSALHKLQLLKNITNKSIVNPSKDTLDGNGNDMPEKPLHKDKSNNISTKETSIKEVNTPQNKDEKSFGMSALQRKLQLFKKLSNNVSSSDTSNKGTSDDENDIIEKINKEYPLTSNKKLLETTKDQSQNVEIDAILNNVGEYMCNFVEKLVTPVLMVHSKFNKAFKPVYTMPDIPFNEHIHIVLRNMSVKGPMDLQSISWYTILRGHSVFMISPKDSGKTMGYLPCVCRLVSDGTPETESIGPICIIVCATAESVTAVERLSKMLLGVNEKVLACYAGVEDLYITTSLLNRCDLLICTPPALTRIFQDTDFGVDLRRLRTFVFDDCERLEQVYQQEIKFFHYKIRELEKNRANKELRVQYIVASRLWCDFMEALAKKAPDTVLCIGSFCECVLYAKASMSVSFVAKSNKVNTVCDFLSETDAAKKAVIVCRHNSDVELLERELKYLKRYIFVGHSDLTISELYNLSAAWRDYKVPAVGPVLLCTDDTLSHMNITDAHYLVHYSLPNSFSMFRKRFAVLIDNYPSMFSSDRENIKMKILLQDEDTEKLPKILNFIKRCTDNIPPSLDELSNNVLAKRDLSKAKKLVPICEALLSLGYCPDFYDCLNRHKILKDFDEPSDWLPKTGTITFKILYYHTATCYSVRLLSHIEQNQESKFPQTYNTLSLKLGMHYGKASNRKLHGIPKVGDICAVSVEYNLFARCQVIKILNTYQRGNPNYVLIKLLDEEKYERSRDIYLYHLPKEFRGINTYVIQVRLANVQPKDKDVTFSSLAREHVRNLVIADEDIYLRSPITGVIGNCVFVDTLEACQRLSTLDEIVVKHNIKRELLDKHAESNPDHIPKLQELCLQNDVRMIFERDCVELKKVIKEKVTPSWAYLENEASGVFISSVINPSKLFVRLSKFEPCMHIIITDIKEHLKTKPERTKSFEIGDIVIAKYPEDDFYERARIDGIENDRVKCFFVDMGDWKLVSKRRIYPITDKLITQLPFQAIECRLFNVKAPGAEWTDFCINWLSDYSDEGTTQFYAKYYIKEKAEFTGGHKYAISLVDTNGDVDREVNRLMIELNLAQQVDEDLRYVGKIVKTDINEISKAQNEDDEWTKISDSPRDSEPDVEFQKVPLSNVFLPQPLRSVPLVDSDCESDNDKWEIYKPEDFLSDFVPKLKEIAQPASELPALTANGLEVEEIRNSKLKPIFNDELDSDDLTDSPADTSQEDSLSIKPKLVWRQNKSFVTIKIQLIGVDKYNLLIEDRAVSFSTYHNDTNYNFKFDLYAVVEKSSCTHANKGQYILVKFVKVLQKNWLTLTKDPSIKKWIIYDVDGIEASSDEETIDDSIKKIAKQMHEEQVSDSDDEDFVDDANYKYK